MGSPLLVPPDVGHEPHNPVRDDRKLAPTEDLDRQPDGVPHSVVAMTAGFSVLLAIMVCFMFLAGHGATRVLGVLLALIAVPVLVKTMSRKADKDRDHWHPSR